MNGVHDMGGMHGMGAIAVDKNEPVFHAAWEGRAYGLTRAMGGWRLWNLDATRFQRELIAPVDYFRMSYYERWIAALRELMLKNQLVTRTELSSGRPDEGAALRTPVFTADKVPGLVTKGVPARRDVPVPASYRIRQRVRARNINPVGHTRPSMSIYGMIILNPRDATLLAGNLADLPRIPLDEGGPIFAEPWQAQAFALAVRLSAQGHFTWKEWAASLADELKVDAQLGEPDDGSRYYHCWLTTLERLVVDKRLADAAALLARKEAWAEAYRRTPHGKPVELENESGC